MSKDLESKMTPQVSKFIARRAFISAVAVMIIFGWVIPIVHSWRLVILGFITYILAIVFFLIILTLQNHDL